MKALGRECTDSLRERCTQPCDGSLPCLVAPALGHFKREEDGLHLRPAFLPAVVFARRKVQKLLQTLLSQVCGVLDQWLIRQFKVRAPQFVVPQKRHALWKVGVQTEIGNGSKCQLPEDKVRVCPSRNVGTISLPQRIGIRGIRICFARVTVKPSYPKPRDSCQLS